jgi:hypothetical protein
MKQFGYCLLIGRWSIFDTKWHHNPHKSPLINNKGGLVLVLWCNQNMMTSLKSIQKGINLMFDKCVNKLIGKRQHVRIFLCCHIELLEIHTNFQLPIFLGTTTIGDNQVASSTSLIKPTTSNLFMFCLTK